MPFNGSGGTSQPASSIYPATANTLIESAKFNISVADLYTMLASCIVKDGQQVTTARIPFASGISNGSQTLTAVADGTATTHAATLGQIQSSAAHLLGSVSGTNTIAAATTPALAAYASGQKFVLVPANTNTGATTINVSTVGAKNVFWNGAACVGGELRQNIPCIVEYDGTQFHIIANGFNAPFLDTHPFVQGSVDSTKKARFEADDITTATTRIVKLQDEDCTLNAVPGLLYGLTLSNNVADATNDIDIATGRATDGTGAAGMILASALTKRLDANWVVGTNQGGLDTGAIANGTYHVWLIKRSDTAVVDVLFSTSASAPTMPSNYDFKRRIGSILREAGAIVAFTQNGDEFLRSAGVLDINATNPGITAVTATLSVPAGVKVVAILNLGIDPSVAGAAFFYVSPLDVSDQAAAIGAAAPLSSLSTDGSAGHLPTSGPHTVRTNTSAQIRYRAGLSGGGQAYRIATLGWVDSRGRNA